MIVGITEKTEKWKVSMLLNICQKEMSSIGSLPIYVYLREKSSS